MKYRSLSSVEPSLARILNVIGIGSLLVIAMAGPFHSALAVGPNDKTISGVVSPQIINDLGLVSPSSVAGAEFQKNLAVAYEPVRKLDGPTAPMPTFLLMKDNRAFSFVLPNSQPPAVVISRGLANKVESKDSWAALIHHEILRHFPPKEFTDRSNKKEFEAAVLIRGAADVTSAGYNSTIGSRILLEYADAEIKAQHVSEPSSGRMGVSLQIEQRAIPITGKALQDVDAIVQRNLKPTKRDVQPMPPTMSLVSELATNDLTHHAPSLKTLDQLSAEWLLRFGGDKGHFLKELVAENPTTELQKDYLKLASQLSGVTQKVMHDRMALLRAEMENAPGIFDKLADSLGELYNSSLFATKGSPEKSYGGASGFSCHGGGCSLVLVNPNAASFEQSLEMPFPDAKVALRFTPLRSIHAVLLNPKLAPSDALRGRVDVIETIPEVGGPQVAGYVHTFYVKDASEMQFPHPKLAVDIQLEDQGKYDSPQLWRKWASTWEGRFDPDGFGSGIALRYDPTESIYKPAGKGAPLALQKLVPWWDVSRGGVRVENMVPVEPGGTPQNRVVLAGYSYGDRAYTDFSNKTFEQVLAEGGATEIIRAHDSNTHSYQSSFGRESGQQKAAFFGPRSQVPLELQAAVLNALQVESSGAQKAPDKRTMQAIGHLTDDLSRSPDYGAKLLPILAAKMKDHPVFKESLQGASNHCDPRVLRQLILQALTKAP